MIVSYRKNHWVKDKSHIFNRNCGGLSMVLLFTIYISISFLSFRYWFNRDRQESIYLLSLIVFLPVIGYLFFFIPRLKNVFISVNNRNENIYRVPNEIAPSKEIMKGLDESVALNLIPFEDTLYINKESIKRAAILDLLKNDMGKLSPLLGTALSDKDTETSHYAAVGIVEIKNKLMKELHEYKANYDALKDENSLISYAYALKKYLGCGYWEEASKENLMNVYQTILDKLLSSYEGEEDFYIDRINYEIEQKNFYKAGIYCKRFRIAHKESEKPYLMYLKLYYTAGDMKNFSHVLNALKRSEIAISFDTWDIAKFWMEGQVQI